MARWQGSAADRGYGPAHQQERKRRLALYRPGDPCAMGGEPLPYPVAVAARWLDLPHDHVNGGYLDGLSCRAHNRAEGASRGNRIQPRQIAARGSDVRCKTCGQPYHYAARICPVCGVHYHPSRKVQYTCGRICGVEYRRRVNNGNLTRHQCACGRQTKGSALCAKCRAEVAAQERQLARQRQMLAKPGLHSKVYYYTCRYCGDLKAAKVTAQRREVCPADPCQAKRLNENRMRNDGRPGIWVGIERPQLKLRSSEHPCPGCGELTIRYRWCDACLCTSANGKGKRCGNAAATDGACQYHAIAA